MSKKTLIFDLDGTLLNSLEDIALSMNEALEYFSISTYPTEDYKYFVGAGVDTLVSNILKQSNSKIDKNLLASKFKEIYEKGVHNNTKPYDGIYDLLDTLAQNCNLAVLSNKPHQNTIAYVDKFFKNYPFLEVHGQKDDTPKKPDPTAAIQIAKNLNLTCEEIYFVGDTKIDMQTAKNASMKSIGVLWGFRTEDELVGNGANFIVSHPLEIVDIINNN